MRGGYHFLPPVNECPARQRSFNMAGLMAKYRLYTKLKSNLRGDANLFARLTWGRFWADGRQSGGYGKVLVNAHIGN